LRFLQYTKNTYNDDLQKKLCIKRTYKSIVQWLVMYANILDKP